MDCKTLLINIFSILASGLISLGITAFYTKQTYRNSALSSVVSKVFIAKSNYITKDTVNTYQSIIQLYEFKYLKKVEADNILELYHWSNAICKNTRSNIYAIALRDIYSNSISSDMKITDINGTTINIHISDKKLDELKAKVEKTFIKYIGNDYGNITCFLDITDKMIKEINENNNIIFNLPSSFQSFNKSTFVDLLKNNSIVKCISEDEKNYYRASKNFEKTFKKYITSNLYESILESEGYH